MRHRILYVEVRGELSGGGQISLYNLLRALDRKRFEPVLVCPCGGSLVDKVKKMGIEVEVVPLPTLKTINPFQVFSSIDKFRSLIKKRGIELVHTNGSRATFYAGIAARPFGLPVVWHVRITQSDGLYDRFLAGMCRCLIVVSQAVGMRFKCLKDKGKIVVIYNGVDCEIFNPGVRGEAMRGEFGIGEDTPVAGVVGNLISGKGQDVFIRAISTVAREIPEAKFFIVGDGACRGNLVGLTEELGIADRVIFTGRRSDIPRVMAAMDVVVQSSISPEAFPRVVIEGMASGRPVIGMKEGGVPEAVEHGISGLLVPPRNPAAMAEAIINLLKDKSTAARMGEMAYQTAKKKFSIEENIKRVEELYLRTLE